MTLPGLAAPARAADTLVKAMAAWQRLIRNGLSDNGDQDFVRRRVPLIDRDSVDLNSSAAKRLLENGE